MRSGGVRLAPFADVVALAGRTPTRQEARTWVLVHDVTIYGVTIPAGFLTDLASIPRFAAPWIDRAAWPWIRPGILHDFRYAQQTIERRDADDEMIELCADLDAPLAASCAMWLAVRAFGWWAWRRRAAEGVDARILKGTPCR